MSDLEAQARELLRELIDDESILVRRIWPDGKEPIERRIAAWARRLLAESRAGALKEARSAVAAADNFGSAYEAVHDLLRAAEAEPGAQDRAGKEEA